jgi:hypothetical protein
MVQQKNIVSGLIQDHYILSFNEQRYVIPADVSDFKSFKTNKTVM